MYIIFSLSIHRLLDTLAVSRLAVVKRAATNMDVQVSLLYIDLHSFRYMPKSGVPGHKEVYF
jgi:hypothetical protein